MRHEHRVRSGSAAIMNELDQLNARAAQRIVDQWRANGWDVNSLDDIEFESWGQME